MPALTPPLYLASQSPRRRQLMENVGLSFTIVDPSGEEDHPDAHTIDEVVQGNAHRKAHGALGIVGAPNAIAIGADTLVMIGERVLGKPKSPDDARAMLELLSGREHTVVTGIALLAKGGRERRASVRSRVKFRPLAAKEIEEYLRTKEPHDKAGSYAIQGMGALFIERIEGSYTNVMGLPIEKLLTELEAVSGIPLWQWFLK